MPEYCSVPGCKVKKGGHKFPKDPEMLMKWRIAIKRMDGTTKKLWTPGPRDVVCNEHFKPEDYRDSLLGERRRLKDKVVPSIFAFRSLPSQSSLAREERRKRKIECVPDHVEVCDVGNEVEIDLDEKIECEIESAPQTEKSQTVGVQCELIGTREDRYTIENFQTNDKAVQYYTGFDNYQHFLFFYELLGPAVEHLEYQCSLLHPKDQLFLTLIKLRQAKEDFELSLFFKVSESTVSTIVNTWINFLYFQLKEIKVWPSKEVVQQHMPEDFGKKFRSTRVILDATEIPIKKPSNVEAQSSTFSTYKHKNTLKTLVGCTPRGVVSFVSVAYGGSASDRQIIERSELCTQKDMFEKKDSVMADRGLMVQDLFASQDVYVNTPTMLKGKSQLEPEEVVHDRRVASKRIHVERVIGLSKTFKILKRELPASKTKLGSRIIYICFMISNFRSAIVNKLA